MLGFTYYVSELDETSIGYWSDSGRGWDWSYSWLEPLVDKQKAELIVNKGGYPYVYKVRLSDVPDDEKTRLTNLNNPDEDRWILVEAWDQS